MKRKGVAIVHIIKGGHIEDGRMLEKELTDEGWKVDD